MSKPEPAASRSNLAYTDLAIQSPPRAHLRITRSDKHSGWCATANSLRRLPAAAKRCSPRDCCAPGKRCAWFRPNRVNRFRPIGAACRWAKARRCWCWKIGNTPVREAPTVLGEIIGFGMSSDAHHITQPCVDGPANAMAWALRDAAIEPDAIDYINAHGTGTQTNDITESQAIRAVFGSKADTMPVSSTKSMHGHTLGAAGAVEAVATLLALEHGHCAAHGKCVGNRSRVRDTRGSFGTAGGEARYCAIEHVRLRRAERVTSVAPRCEGMRRRFKLLDPRLRQTSSKSPPALHPESCADVLSR